MRTLEQLARAIEQEKAHIAEHLAKHPNHTVSAVIEAPLYLVQEYVELKKQGGEWVTLMTPMEEYPHHWFKAHHDTIEVRTPAYKVELNFVEQ